MNDIYKPTNIYNEVSAKIKEVLFSYDCLSQCDITIISDMILKNLHHLQDGRIIYQGVIYDNLQSVPNDTVMPNALLAMDQLCKSGEIQKAASDSVKNAKSFQDLCAIKDGIMI